MDYVFGEAQDYAASTQNPSENETPTAMARDQESGEHHETSADLVTHYNPLWDSIPLEELRSHLNTSNMGDKTEVDESKDGSKKRRGQKVQDTQPEKKRRTKDDNSKQRTSSTTKPVKDGAGKATSKKGRSNKLPDNATAVERQNTDEQMLLGIYRLPSGRAITMTAGIYNPGPKAKKQAEDNWHSALDSAVAVTKKKCPGESWYKPMVKLIERVRGLEPFKNGEPKEMLPQADNGVMETYRLYLVEVKKGAGSFQDEVDFMGVDWPVDIQEPMMAIPKPELKHFLTTQDVSEAFEEVHTTAMSYQKTGGGRMSEAERKRKFPPKTKDDPEFKLRATIPELYKLIGSEKTRNGRHHKFPAYFNYRGEIYSKSHHEHDKETVLKPFIEHHAKITRENPERALSEADFRSCLATPEATLEYMKAPAFLNSKGKVRKREPQSTQADHDEHGKFKSGTRAPTSYSIDQKLIAMVERVEPETLDAEKTKQRTDVTRNSIRQAQLNLGQERMEMHKQTQHIRSAMREMHRELCDTKSKLEDMSDRLLRSRAKNILMARRLRAAGEVMKFTSPEREEYSKMINSDGIMIDEAKTSLAQQNVEEMIQTWNQEQTQAAKVDEEIIEGEDKRGEEDTNSAHSCSEPEELRQDGGDDIHVEPNTVEHEQLESEDMLPDVNSTCGQIEEEMTKQPETVAKPQHHRKSQNPGRVSASPDPDEQRSMSLPGSPYFDPPPFPPLSPLSPSSRPGGLIVLRKDSAMEHHYREAERNYRMLQELSKNLWFPRDEGEKHDNAEETEMM